MRDLFLLGRGERISALNSNANGQSSASQRMMFARMMFAEGRGPAPVR